MDEADFKIVLEEVFGPKSEGFSDDLRQLLREMWARGVEHGVYARTEKEEVPWDVVEPPRLAPRAAQKLEEMEAVRDKLVEKAETVALRLEHCVDPSPIGRLEGDDLTKGVHNFLTRTARIDKKLAELLQEAEKFRVFEA
jgi:hypothetical protein